MSASPPGPGNDFLSAHTELLRNSYRERSGRELVDPALSASAAALALWEAPFALLSHDTAEDPLLTYANRTALGLFELDWQGMLATPSRLTAEAPVREERARLLARVRQQGFIDDYAGVRISRSGRRFRIESATVWNLTDATGSPCGQAATFARWSML